MRRVLKAGLVCAAALAVLVACGSTQTARRQPHPHAAQTATPAPSPAVTQAPVAAPSASGAPVTPAPTSTSSLIPHHEQALTLSGAVSGTVGTAEVKECGTGHGAWALELSSMTVKGGTASLTLLVNSYHGAGSYLPSGALNTIRNQQLATFSVSGGSVDIAGTGSSGDMSLKLASAAGQQVQIQGTWACS